MSSLDELMRQVKALRDELAIYKRNQEYTQDVLGARDAWQVSEEDNVDASNSLLIDLYIPPNGVTRHIQQVLLRVKLKAFRSYSAVTASGGGSTETSSSGGGTTVTSVSGGGETVTSTSGGATVPTTSVESTDYGTISSVGFVIQDSNTAAHDHGGATGSTSGGDFSAHTHSITNFAGDSHIHDNYVHYHTVSVPNHQHNVTTNNHAHDVTIGNHTHNVTIPSHTHGITAAITTGATATGCTIVINGTDRTNALTGGATFATDQDELDVTQYMTATGYNTISITSSGLGRIRCTAFVNLYLNDR